MKQNDLQSIRALLKEQLRNLQEIKYDLKDEIDFHWTYANEETNAGKYHFLMLNYKRNDLIKVNKKIKTLNTLTKSVKKEMNKDSRLAYMII